jgi:hypothetical protein
VRVPVKLLNAVAQNPGAVDAALDQPACDCLADPARPAGHDRMLG